jgi:hypothetical protein
MKVALLLTGFALTAALLAGCSGAGAPASQITGASVQALATDQLSAVVLARSWDRFLYARPGTGTQTENDRFTATTWYLNGDLSDGGHYRYAVSLTDYSGTGRITWHDGMFTTLTWGVSVPSGPTNSIHTTQVQQTFEGGQSLNYADVTDFSNPAQTKETWQGTGTLKDGSSMNFVVTRLLPAPNGQDQIVVTLPTGDKFQLQVSTELHTGGSGVAFPVYSAGAQGSVQSGAANLAFSLSGHAGAWDRWAFTAGSGWTGAFTLGSDYSGGGNLSQGGALEGAMHWDATGKGTLTQLGTAASGVTPSAAALAFEINTWLHNAAAMGPMPLY